MNSFKRIMHYIWKYKYLMIIPLISIAITVGLDLFNPYLTKVLIDDVIIGGKMELLNRILWFLISINIIRGVFMYIRGYMLEMVSENSMLDLKYALYNHIHMLPFKTLDSIETGELMSRMTSDIDSIKAVIAFGASILIENIAYFISATVILFNINAALTWASMAALPMVAVLAVRFENLIDKIYGQISDQAAKLNSTAEQNIAGARLVKAFARESYEIKKFMKENKTFLDKNIEETELWAKYLPLIDFISGLGVVLLIALGGYMVIRHIITIGDLVAFNGYIWMMIWPMRNIGWLVNLLAQARASSRKICQILDTSAEPLDGSGIVMQNMKGHVRFENVYFSYGHQEILKGITIDAPAGSTIAIMGATGSGKTSIINLIGRYYDCTAGRITIDGIDVKDMELKSLRNNIGIIMQETFLFSDTIAANIAFGKPDATFEEIKAAAIAAKAHDFIMDMPEGYDTIIGERGVGLSGGQKQRIAIARAIIKNPRILILDDATSAVDMETEHEIQKELKAIMAGRTAFIIAHRISSVKNADEILVMENGRIIERGSHYELLALKQRYYSIYKAQYKDLEQIEGEVV